MTEENGKTPETAGSTELTREQLQANVRVSAEWLNAVKAGTFPGSVIPSIAGLIGFLVNQNSLATQEFEKASQLHPEWGNLRLCENCKQVPGKHSFIGPNGSQFICETCLQQSLNKQPQPAMAQ